MTHGSTLQNSASSLLDEHGMMTRGKFRGAHVSTVPSDYLQTLISANRDAIDLLQGELDRRAAIAEASQSVGERIVDAGFKSLAVKFHPDKGGDPATMRALIAAREKLREMLRDSGEAR
jgi:hypothetical protein